MAQPVVIVTGESISCGSVLHSSSFHDHLYAGASKGLGLEIVKILLNRYSAKVVAVSRSVPQPLKDVADASQGAVELVTGE